MASLLRSYQLLVAAALIVAVFVTVAESSRNTRPFIRPRGSIRRLGVSRSATGGRGRSHHDSQPEILSARRMKNAGTWFQKFIASKHAASSNPLPSEPERPAVGYGPDHEKVIVRPPIIKSGSIVTSPAITMIFLETIDVRKRNTSRPVSQAIEADRERPQDIQQEEPVTNQATTLPSNPRPSRRAFTADEARIQCGGPNEAGQTEECYRFELPADLNNNAIVISGAVVLLPAGDGFPASRSHGNTHHRSIHHNVTIVAKFPTSGEGAYSESISVQNISYDIPWKWKSASLPQGSQLVSRALEEDNTLVLKLSIITSSDGHPITSNFIPMESNMLPVLVVDIEFNGTDSSASSTTTTTTTTVGNTQANVVERRLRERRRVSKPSSTDSHPSTSATCTGYPGCCRRPIEITFSDLGWDWILAPRKYTTNVCLGSCSTKSFTSYVADYLQGQRSSASPINRQCQPSRTQALEILVFDDDSDIRGAILPDIVVTDCACSGQMDITPSTTKKSRFITTT